MHLVADLNLSFGISDREAASRALAKGLIAPALSGFYENAEATQGLLLGYAGLTEVEIRRDVKRLVMALT